MPISLRTATAGGSSTIGQVVRMADGLPVDYTDRVGHRFLRGGYIETNPSLFDNTIWADSIGTLWREVYRDSASQSNNITGVYFVNDTFFVTFQNSAAGLKSTDGINWTPVTFGFSNVRDMAFGAGVYTIVGGSGVISTSPDLITWTSRTSGTAEGFQCVTFANGQFLAGANNGFLATSPNGITWTSRTTGFSATQDIFSINYAFGLYIASGGDGNTSYKIATSTDGITWTNRAVASGVANMSISSMAFNGSRLVGVQSNVPMSGFYQLVYSDNGTTWNWTAADDFNNSDSSKAATTVFGWGSGIIAAIGGKFYSGRMRSGDGLRWDYISTGYTIGAYAGDSSKIVCAGYRQYRSPTGNPTEDSDPSRSISLSTLSAGVSESISEGGTEQYVRIS